MKVSTTCVFLKNNNYKVSYYPAIIYIQPLHFTSYFYIDYFIQFPQHQKVASVGRARPPGKIGDAHKRGDWHFILQLDTCQATVPTTVSLVLLEQGKELRQDGRVGSLQDSVVCIPFSQVWFPGGTEGSSHMCLQVQKLDKNGSCEWRLQSCWDLCCMLSRGTHQRMLCDATHQESACRSAGPEAFFLTKEKVVVFFFNELNPTPVAPLLYLPVVIVNLYVILCHTYQMRLNRNY